MGVESMTTENNNDRRAYLETLPASESQQGTMEHVSTLEDGTRLTIAGELKMHGQDQMSLLGNSEDGTAIQVILYKEGDEFIVQDISYPDQAQAA